MNGLGSSHLAQLLSQSLSFGVSWVDLVLLLGSELSCSTGRVNSSRGPTLVTVFVELERRRVLKLVIVFAAELQPGFQNNVVDLSLVLDLSKVLHLLDVVVESPGPGDGEGVVVVDVAVEEVGVIDVLDSTNHVSLSVQAKQNEEGLRDCVSGWICNKEKSLEPCSCFS